MRGTLKKAKDVKDVFLISTTQATATTGILDRIIEISSIGIEDIIKKTTPSHSTKIALENHIKIVRNLKKSPIISESSKTIYLQQVVLIFSAFETYISDLVRVIGNDFRHVITWPEDKSGSIDLSFLSSQTTTVGDLILAIIEKRNVSFQDLKSTKDFFDKYLGIKLVFNNEDLMILTAAIRNATVHNGAIIDHKFTRQIRNTSYSNDYVHGERIELTQKFVREVMSCFQGAGRNLFELLPEDVKND